MIDAPSELPSIKKLLFAILLVAVVDLMVDVMHLRSVGTGAEISSGSADSVASQLGVSEAELDALATSVIEPLNAQDWDTLWERFDDFAKTQVSKEEFSSQLATLVDLVGTLGSASFVGSEFVPGQGGLEFHKLSYQVGLSGERFRTGRLNITVIHREAGPGIVGVYVLGGSQ